MLKYIRNNRLYVQIIFIWFVTGYFISPVLYALVPITIFTLSGKDKYLILFLGFWIILVFSDALERFEAAKNVKILYLFILLFFAFKKKQILFGNNFYKSFLPFFGISAISMALSPILFTSVQKTLSYFLIIFIVPPYISFLLKTNKKKLLLGLVYTGSLILFTGLVMIFISSEFTHRGGRFSGVFGNPNGLGIFIILFSMLWNIIKFYYPKLFTKKDSLLINS